MILIGVDFRPLNKNLIEVVMVVSFCGEYLIAQLDALHSLMMPVLILFERRQKLLS